MDYQKLDEILESITGTRHDSPKAYQTEKTREHSSEGDRDCILDLWPCIITLCPCTGDDDDSDCGIVAHCVITCNDYCCCEGHCDPHNCYHD